MSILLLIIAILPIFLIGLFIYRKDSRKEPFKLLLKLFFGGVISCFPAVLFESIVSSSFPQLENMNFFQIFLYSFICIALIEELCKWIFVYKISYNHNEFDTLYDMIVYSSFVSLGFACLENILYVFSNGVMVGFVRAITAVPGHVCDGILMGFYLSLSKVNYVKGNYKLSKKFKVLSILIPIVTHGIYDFCVFLGNPFCFLIFILYVIIIFVYCFNKVRKLSLNDYKFKYNNNYCVNCGSPVSSKFCTKCGNENK